MRRPVWRLPVLAGALVALGVAGAGSAEAKPAAKAKVSAAATKVGGAKVKPAVGKNAKATVKERSDANTSDSDSAQEGVGSWYGKYFHGRQTASGELFNMHAYTAAHRSLPIPSFARVRNLSNGREVIVRINDRGPYVGHRVIDLSMAAANRLGISGIGRVRIEPLAADAIHNGQWRIDDGRPVLPDELALGGPDRTAGLRATAEPAVARAGVASDEERLKPAESAPTTQLASAAEPGDATVPPAVAAAPEVLESASRELVAEEAPDGFEAVATAPGASLPRTTARPRNATSAHRDGAGHAVTGRDAKDGKDLAFAGPLPSAALPVAAPAAGVEMGPPAAPIAAASAAAPALASTEAGAAAVVAPVAAVAPRELAKAEEAPAAKPLMSGLLAGVAATVTPVLTGLARSATGVKDTVVSLAAPITAKAVAPKPGAVQIDPARTSSGRGWWVQLGAFDESSHAMRFQHKVIDMAPWIGPLLGIFDEKGERKLQAGPYPTREQAQRALERAREALKTSPVMVQRR